MVSKGGKGLGLRVLEIIGPQIGLNPASLKANNKTRKQNQQLWALRALCLRALSLCLKACEYLVSSRY